MLANVKSCALTGYDAYIVDVEADVSRGLPKFEVVGLPALAVKESKDRVRAALKNIGESFPNDRIVVNLAPADTEKDSAMLDLPILLSVAIAAEMITPLPDDTLYCGEVSLSGDLRPIHGAVAIAACAVQNGYKKLVLPVENAEEAAMIEGIEIYGINNIANIFLMKQQCLPLEPYERKYIPHENCYLGLPDFSEVKGHLYAKRAIEVAVAGGHNIAMIGPAGSGKSMLAKRIPSILPPLTKEQSIETTKIHSVAGELSRGMIRTAPFRSPHHTVSAVGLAGGGRIPRPGEISLAHNGVLFLDEFPEFARSALEIMRQPLEDGKLTIARASGSQTFPADFMLVCAMNPCKCGNFGGIKPCKCTERERNAYLSHISGPMWDRIDIKIDVPAVSINELESLDRGESSAGIRERVFKAREIQRQRLEPYKITVNAAMSHALIEKFCTPTNEGRELIHRYFNTEKLSARGYDRLLKVARTIADLNGVEMIGIREIAEAISYKTKII